SESRHIFFNTNGLSKAVVTEEQINILEIGFGTALNLLLLIETCKKTGSQTKINYYTIEAHPISSQTFEDLNYGQQISGDDTISKLKAVFDSLQPGKNRYKLLP